MTRRLYRLSHVRDAPNNSKRNTDLCSWLQSVDHSSLVTTFKRTVAVYLDDWVL